MFGAAPGRETIFIFCVCWINCTVVCYFFKDGERILKTQRRARTPVLFLKISNFSRGVWGVFIAKQTDNSTLIHLTDSPAFNLFFCLLFLTSERGERSIREPKCESLSAPRQKCCIDSHSSNLSFLFFFVVVVVVVRQHGIMTLSKWR